MNDFIDKVKTYFNFNSLKNKAKITLYVQFTQNYIWSLSFFILLNIFKIIFNK